MKIDETTRDSLRVSALYRGRVREDLELFRPTHVVSLLDPALAPEGQHVLSIWLQYAPFGGNIAPIEVFERALASSDARQRVHARSAGSSTPSVALSRNLSRKAAFEMLVTGDFISADEALAKGLVNRVVDAAGLDAEVERLVARIVAKPRTPIALGKALFYRQLEAGIEAAYEDAGRTMACNMMDHSALEGVQAFIEKRPPVWH